MKTKIIVIASIQLILFILFAKISFSARMPKENVISNDLERLTSKLEAGIEDYDNIKIAVLQFPYTNGKVSEGSIIIQERITSIFARNKRITLIERDQLKKIFKELELHSTGVVDDKTTKKLGKLLGADAITMGTLNDINNEEVEINARIVQTETGKILSAGNVVIKKTWK
jgi:TolB-like protein